MRKYFASLIIPTHNNNSGLQRLLESLSLQKNIEQCQIILVANPDSTSFRALVKEWSAKLPIEALVSAPNGVNRARNKGLEFAKSDIVFFFDDDCWLGDKELLMKHVHFLDQHPEVSLLGGKYQIPESSSLSTQAYQMIQEEWISSTMSQPPYFYQCLLGGHFSGRKAELMKYKFDDSIRYGGSETELFARRLPEQSTLLPELVVMHDPSLWAWQLWRKGYFQGRGSAYINQKNYFFQSKLISSELIRIRKKMLESSVTTKFLIFFYRLSFKSGYRMQMKNKKIYWGPGYMALELMSYWASTFRNLKMLWMQKLIIRVKLKNVESGLENSAGSKSSGSEGHS